MNTILSRPLAASSTSTTLHVSLSVGKTNFKTTCRHAPARHRKKIPMTVGNRKFVMLTIIGPWYALCCKNSVS